VLIALQVALGVEAWMGKFGEEARGGRPASSYLAEAAPVTARQAEMRTAHTLVGTGVLAAALVLFIRIRQRPMIARDNPSDRDVIWDRQFAPEPALALALPTEPRP